MSWSRETGFQADCGRYPCRCAEADVAQPCPSGGGQVGRDPTARRMGHTQITPSYYNNFNNVRAGKTMAWHKPQMIIPMIQNIQVISRRIQGSVASALLSCWSPLQQWNNARIETSTVPESAAATYGGAFWWAGGEPDRPELGSRNCRFLRCYQRTSLAGGLDVIHFYWSHPTAPSLQGMVPFKPQCPQAAMSVDDPRAFWQKTDLSTEKPEDEEL